MSRAVRAAREGRNRRACARPGGRTSPDDTGAARPEQPLVAAGDEEVAAQRSHVHRFDAERVHAVDAQQRAAAVAQSLGDLRDRQLHARARVHPGQRDAPPCPRRRARTTESTISASVARCGIAVQRDPPHRRAERSGGEPQRLMRGVEVVGRRHDLLAGLQSEPAVEQAEPHGRRVGERDVDGPGPEVAHPPGAARPPRAGRRNGAGSPPDRRRGRAGGGRSRAARARDAKQGRARPCGSARARAETAAVRRPSRARCPQPAPLRPPRDRHGRPRRGPRPCGRGAACGSSPPSLS